MKRYLLCPGHVTSKSDGQTHFIDARRLAMLYGVPMSQCEIRPKSQIGWTPPEGAVELRPDYHGRYQLPA